MWKEVADKDMADLRLKPNDAVGHSKWMEKIRRNWSDSNSEVMIWVKNELYISDAG